MLIAALSETLTGNTGLSCNMKVWITRLFALVAGRDLMVSSVPLNPQAQCIRLLWVHAYSFAPQKCSLFHIKNQNKNETVRVFSKTANR